VTAPSAPSKSPEARCARCGQTIGAFCPSGNRVHVITTAHARRTRGGSAVFYPKKAAFHHAFVPTPKSERSHE
jgi:hypothetical protein